MSLFDWDDTTCLILQDTPMYSFSSSMNQWLPQPQHACWKSGLVIMHRVPITVKASFSVRITGHSLLCTKSHFTVTTRSTELSDCGRVSGSICRLSDVTESEGRSLRTCVAACPYKVNQTKYVFIEIPNMYKDAKLCEISIE